MPAFITHLLISQDLTFRSLDIEAISKNQTYFSLGSLGPDLPYYGNVFGTAIGTFFEEKFYSKLSGFYKGYGDYFHSKTPNLFPMKLLEVIKKDNEGDPNGRPKLAFAYGYLTHMAADWVIHPYVNKLAGSYYLSVDNSRTHRNIEVCLDNFMFNIIKKKNLFDEDITKWIDVAPPKKETPPSPDMNDPSKIEWKEYTFDWFRSFVQRAFLETYSIIINEEDIEKWVSGFNSVLQSYNSIGPYHDMIDNKKSEFAKLYKTYNVKFQNDKVLDLYGSAVELSKKFIQAADAFFRSPQVSNTERDKFLGLVPEADLTAPLMAPQI